MDFEGEYVSVGTSDGEQIDIVAAAQEAFAERGFKSRRVDHNLILEDSGIVCAPRMIALDDSGEGSLATSTIVRFKHPQLFADGAFEYQHSRGDSVRESINTGFTSWANMDLACLVDALSEQPANASYMDMEFPADAGGSLRRRAVFGPASHYAAEPVPDDGAGADHDGAGFCPCCLTTNCMVALMELFKSDAAYGLRLYAARDSDGEAQADCRVNGEDFEAGKQALIAYVRSWPHRGLEFRKQFVVIRPVPTPA